MLVTPEIKKGKYIYYSYTNAKKTCRRDYVNESIFLDDVGSYFDDLSLTQDMIDAITEYIKQGYESEGKFQKAQRECLKKEQEQLQQRISKLYDDHYDGNIPAFF